LKKTENSKVDSKIQGKEIEKKDFNLTFGENKKRSKEDIVNEPKAINTNNDEALSNSKKENFENFSQIDALSKELHLTKQKLEKAMIEIQKLAKEKNSINNLLEEEKKKDINNIEVQKKNNILIESMKKEIELNSDNREAGESGDNKIKELNIQFNLLLNNFTKLASEKQEICLNFEKTISLLTKDNENLKKLTETNNQKIILLTESKERKNKKIQKQEAMNSELLKTVNNAI